MSVVGHSQERLSHEDVKFMKAVQEIEDNPNKYRKLEITNGRVNTSVLRDILGEGFTDRMVRYRMVPGERGLEDSGLVRLYDPEVQPDGSVGPRSIELTDKGRKAILDWEKRHGEMDADSWDTTTVERMEMEISQLRSEVDRLDSELARQERAETSEGTDTGELQELRQDIQALTSRVDVIAGRVQSFDDDKFGAINDHETKALKRAMEIIGRYRSIFEALGISRPREAPPVESFEDEEAAERVRESVREALGVPAAPGEETTTPPERGTLDQQAQREVPPDQPVDEVDLQNDGSSSG
jgi:TolA-binding protein